MSYWDNKSQNAGAADSYGSSGRSGGSGEFYELEPAIVLDIVLDKEHPIFKNQTNLQTNVDVDRWPADYKGDKAIASDIDYSWMGRALVRMQYSSPTTQKENLIWAYPLESSISEYPLVNEIVMVMKYRTKYFYSRKINTKNFPNEAVDFNINSTISGQENTQLYSNALYQGRTSQTSADGKIGQTGISGKYYKLNDKIRRVKRFEGDTLLESRFGQSIRFSAYDDNRSNDQGLKDTAYADYGGNPMIIIRNRQRKLLKSGERLILNGSKNPCTIFGTEEEKNAGGYIKEDINHDGSTISITAGKTEPIWKTTCYKKMFGMGEEQPKFDGTTSFVYPSPFSGDQIIIQSDRLILSSRFGETLHYSKKRYAVVTDNEYTVDAHQQIVLTTNTKVVVNSPAIYLGEDDNTNEPVFMGQTTVNWLYKFCNLYIAHYHVHEHSHEDAGKPSPYTTQAPIPPHIAAAIALRDELQTLLSRRVFVTGGGFAPGYNGGTITGGTTPTNINVGNGAGVPGGWKGANHR